MSRVTYHLERPKSGQAFCGSPATLMTKWRRFATCGACLKQSAAKPASPNSTVVLAHSGPDAGPLLPVRMSALVEFLRTRWSSSSTEGVMVEEAIAELRADVSAAGSWCRRCEAAIDDPVVIQKPDENRLVFICPACAPEELRRRWEAEGQ